MAHVEQEAIKKELKSIRLRVGEHAKWAISVYDKLGYGRIEKIKQSEGFVLLMEKQV